MAKKSETLNSVKEQMQSIVEKLNKAKKVEQIDKLNYEFKKAKSKYGKIKLDEVCKKLTSSGNPIQIVIDTAKMLEYDIIDKKEIEVDEKKEWTLVEKSKRINIEYVQKYARKFAKSDGIGNNFDCIDHAKTSLKWLTVAKCQSLQTADVEEVASRYKISDKVVEKSAKFDKIMKMSKMLEALVEDFIGEGYTVEPRHVKYINDAVCRWGGVGRIDMIKEMKFLELITELLHMIITSRPFKVGYKAK